MSPIQSWISADPDPFFFKFQSKVRVFDRGTLDLKFGRLRLELYRETRKQLKKLEPNLGKSVDDTVYLVSASVLQ